MRSLAIPVAIASFCLLAVLAVSAGAATPDGPAISKLEDSLATIPIEATADNVSPPSRTLREWYAMGGPAMHALAFCSVLILALIMERGFALRRAGFVPKALVESVERALEVGNQPELKRICATDRSALGHLSRIALEGLAAQERLQAEGSAAAHRAQRNLPLLAALGNLATMLGLLGTVLGMVEAFEVIAQSGTGDARIVASGIFRALVTTAAGLSIGIFALGAHAFFSRRAADFVDSLETLVTRIAEGIGQPHRFHADTDSVETLSS